MGWPSGYASSYKKQAALHKDGKKLNCWRSPERPLPLALLYTFLGRFSQACLNTARPREQAKLFVLELCEEVRCCYLMGSNGPVPLDHAA